MYFNIYFIVQLMHMVIYLLDLLAIQCISSKSHVMAVSLHMKPQSPSTFVTVRQKETGLIVIYYYYSICNAVFLILNCSY